MAILTNNAAYTQIGQQAIGLASASPPSKQTAFTSARDALSGVQRLENRIEAIVNSLVGYPLQVVNEAPAELEPHGLFDALNRQASNASESIARINATLDRLEREF